MQGFETSGLRQSQRQPLLKGYYPAGSRAHRCTAPLSTSHTCAHLAHLCPPARVPAELLGRRPMGTPGGCPDPKSTRSNGGRAPQLAIVVTCAFTASRIALPHSRRCATAGRSSKDTSAPESPETKSTSSIGVARGRDPSRLRGGKFGAGPQARIDGSLFSLEKARNEQKKRVPEGDVSCGGPDMTTPAGTCPVCTLGDLCKLQRNYKRCNGAGKASTRTSSSASFASPPR